MWLSKLKVVASVQYVSLRLAGEPPHVFLVLLSCWGAVRKCRGPDGREVERGAGVMWTRSKQVFLSFYMIFFIYFFNEEQACFFASESL